MDDVGTLRERLAGLDAKIREHTEFAERHRDVPGTLEFEALRLRELYRERDALKDELGRRAEAARADERRARERAARAAAASPEEHRAFAAKMSKLIREKRRGGGSG